MATEFSFTIPCTDDFVPYGRQNTVSVYVKDNVLGEKDFTDHLVRYDFNLVQNLIAYGTCLFYSIEGTDKDYFARGNRVKVFVNNRLFYVFQIKKAAFDTTSAATITLEGREAYISRKITDRSSFNFKDTDSDTVTKYLLSQNNDGNSPYYIQLGSIDNFGKVFYRSEYDDRLRSLMNQSTYHQADWWLSWNESENYDTDYWNLKQNRGKDESVFTFETDGTAANTFLTTKIQDQDNIINNVICLGSGNGETQLISEQYAASTYETALNGGDTWLNGDITSTDTTITVNSTTGFPSSGTIQIGKEQITYTGKTSTTFTGCTRGANSTTASIHLDDADVINLSTLIVDDNSSFPSSGTLKVGQELITYSAKPSSTEFTVTSRGASGTTAYAHSDNIRVTDNQYTVNSPQANSSIDDEGAVSAKFDFRSVISQNMLDLIAQQILSNYQTLKPNIVLLPIDFYDILGEQKLELNDLVTVKDSNADINGEDYRIRSFHLFKPVGGSEALEIELSKVRSNFAEQLATTKHITGDLSSYAQGTVIPIKADMARNCDSGYNLDLKVYIPKDTIGIKSMILNYNIGSYRIYHTDTPSGGGSVTPSGGGGTTTAFTAGVQLDLDNWSENVSTSYDLVSSTSFTLNGTYDFIDVYVKMDADGWGPGTDTLTLQLQFNDGTGSVVKVEDYFTFSSDGFKKVYRIPVQASFVSTSANVYLYLKSSGNNDYTGTVTVYGGRDDHTHDTPNHTHNTPDHTHTINYGISETASAATTISIDVDGVSVSGTFSTTQEQEIDLFNVSGVEWKPGQWHTISIKPDDKCWIDASVFGLVFVES